MARGPGQPYGRPSKLTPERHKLIVMLLQRGNWRQTACQLAKVSYQTFLNWMERGEAGEQPYMAFFEDVLAAESLAEDYAVACMQTHALGDWRAAQAWLALRQRDRWGKVDTIEVRTRPSDDKLAKLGTEQLEQLDAWLADAVSG
jgi:hypothetical protein